jgi:hypothetical protein
VAICPSERPVRFVAPPLEASRLRMLGNGVANTHGDDAIAVRGSFLPTPFRRFVPLGLLPIGGYFA